MAPIGKKCFGLCKNKKTVAEMKTLKTTLTEEIAELKAGIEKWEKAAAAEKIDEETAKTMDFTGKCIVTFATSEDAQAAQKRFNFFK